MVLVYCNKPAQIMSYEVYTTKHDRLGDSQV